MTNNNKIILILVAVIFVLIIVLIIKLNTNIMPTDNKVNLNNNTISINDKKIEKPINNVPKYNQLETLTVGMNMISIGLIIIGIGRFLLYRKIGIPIILNILYQLVISGIIYEIAFISRNITMGVIIIWSMVLIFLITKTIYYNMLNGKGIILWIEFIIGIILGRLRIIKDITSIFLIIFAITLYIQEVIAGFSLVEYFEKNNKYKILIVLFPWIFVPILGFQKNKTNFDKI